MDWETRGLAGAFFDQATAWVLGFPSETCNYKRKTICIPISGGLEQFELAADLYQPILQKNSDIAGTILVRCPYGRGLSMTTLYARPFASRGYQVLFVSCRGTFGSGGEFDPARTEEVDGRGVVDWLRNQDWYTGSFATIGGSYMGFTQWALLCDPPKDMVAAVVTVSPHDYSRHYWGTGSLNLDVIGWSEAVAHQEETGFWATIRKLNSPRRIRPVLDGVPLAEATDTYFNQFAPWLKYRLTHSDLSDPYYKPMQYGRALESAKIPVLLVSGWYDVFFGQTMEQYTRLRESGCEVALTVGPWTHIGAANAITFRQTFDWLEEHLSRRNKNSRPSAVQAYVTGANEWRDLPKWPPPTTLYELYLQPSYELSNAKPYLEISSSSFTFNPQHPTPTIGGNLLYGGGSVDDSALAVDTDVLAFTTEPLERDIELLGKATVELIHSSDNPNVDLFVRLSEVDAKGRSHNITETYRRLDPNRELDIVVLTLYDRGHRFIKGTRIRLIICGGCHPHFGRNLGTGQNSSTGSELRSARHTIHHDRSHVSRLVLPVATLEEISPS